MEIWNFGFHDLLQNANDYIYDNPEELPSVRRNQQSQKMFKHSTRYNNPMQYLVNAMWELVIQRQTKYPSINFQKDAPNTAKTNLLCSY
jgi:hypothetical protein